MCPTLFVDESSRAAAEVVFRVEVLLLMAPVDAGVLFALLAAASALIRMLS